MSAVVELFNEEQQDVSDNVLHQSITKALKFGKMLERFPQMLKQVIERDAWSRRMCHAKGRPFASVLEYMEHNEPDGCQVSSDKIEALIRDDPEVLAMWREATTGNHGGDRGNQYTGGKPDNISLGKESDGYGTSLAYTLHRLRTKRPDLYDRVCRRELSANAAAIEAGIRKPPKKGAAKLRHEWDRSPPEERDQFIQWLRDNGYV